MWLTPENPYDDKKVKSTMTKKSVTVRFEAPRHLPERTIQIRFERKRATVRVVVYYKGERMGEAKPLDPIANDRPPQPRADEKGQL
jgi:ribosome maturation protein Sdo1